VLRFHYQVASWSNGPQKEQQLHANLPPYLHNTTWQQQLCSPQHMASSVAQASRPVTQSTLDLRDNPLL
jgi:hypothetical protein